MWRTSLYGRCQYECSGVFFKLILIVFSIFVLLQGCERVDKANGLGKYAEQNTEEKESNDNDSCNHKPHFPHRHNEM